MPLNPLEKQLVKTGIYSFIIGLLVGLVWVKDDFRTVYEAGTYVTIAKPLKQYVLELLRCAATFTLASLAVQTLMSFAGRRQQDDSFSFAGGFVKSFIVVFAVITLAVPLFMWISAII